MHIDWSYCSKCGEKIVEPVTTQGHMDKETSAGVNVNSSLVDDMLLCLNANLFCLPCLGALARLGGPTAGRGGLMEVCGPTESLMVVIGRNVGTLTAATDTQTTDLPG